MRRASTSFRLQLIKEAAIKAQGSGNYDPMSDYIHQLMDESPETEKLYEANSRFSGTHFDEQAGGWVNDMWTMK
ncbi:hypothetical protein RCJ22_33045 [Vibrio sp. FNV 38]|nr:hypothetical protein [Vibrio sp. FNV 38]